MLIKANPDKEGYVNKGLCCAKGKWGFDASVLEGKVVDPMIKRLNGEMEEADYHEALILAAKNLESVMVQAQSQLLSQIDIQTRKLTQ